LAIIAQNLNAGRSLIGNAIDSGALEETQESRVILRDVPVTLIRDFINSYRFHENSELTSELLNKYIDGQVAAGALTSWNVVVMGRRPPSRTVPLGFNTESPLITRSKLKRTSKPKLAVIGTLMSKPDRVADIIPPPKVSRDTTDEELQALRDNDGRGLLLLYPIDKDSEPKAEAEHRVRLEAAGHLLGVAFSFPQADPESEPDDTIQVDLSLLRTTELDDGSADYADEEGSRDEVDLGDG
jgi:hypothetical protein